MSDFKLLHIDHKNGKTTSVRAKDIVLKNGVLKFKIPSGKEYQFQISEIDNWYTH